MYWLVILLSISGMPEVRKEVNMDSLFVCSKAKEKFIEGNPPHIFVDGVYKKANIDGIMCIKREN